MNSEAKQCTDNAVNCSSITKYCALRSLPNKSLYYMHSLNVAVACCRNAVQWILANYDLDVDYRVLMAQCTILSVQTWWLIVTSIQGIDMLKIKIGESLSLTNAA